MRSTTLHSPRRSTQLSAKTSLRIRIAFISLTSILQAKPTKSSKDFLQLIQSIHTQKHAKLFDQRFGNPVHVAQAYKSRLRIWPQVKDGDSVALQEFSDYVSRCEEAVKITGSISELDSNDNLVHVSAKLPSYSGIKWCRHAYETRTKSRTSVSFSEFVRFVKEESDLANDPVFSPDALRRERRNYSQTSTRENKPRWRNKDRGADSFATSTSQEHTAGQLSPKRTVTKCPLCHRDHALERCLDFKKKRLEDRIEFIKAKGLCFGCLKSGHLSITCQSRLSCDECDKLHTYIHALLGFSKRKAFQNLLQYKNKI